MKTFILFWNPTISNEKGEGRTEFVNSLREEDLYEANWAVWDWKEAHKGDRFYKVMVGNPAPNKNGIVESGFFTSDPYVGGDWSGRGREIHYCDMKYDAVLDYNFLASLSVEKLTKEIPSFDWTGGHSGRLLDEKSAEVLDKIWCEHLIDVQRGKDGDDDEKAEEHLYLCERLWTRLIEWDDPEEWFEGGKEQYSSEPPTDYTQYVHKFIITGVKHLDYNAVLTEAVNIVTPKGRESSYNEMVHYSDDKKVLEDEMIYVKGMSAQGISLTKYKKGYCELTLEWMASAEEARLVFSILSAIQRHSPKSKVKIVHADGEAYEVMVNGGLLEDMQNQRMYSMMGMLIDNAHGIFGINGIRHPFYISPEELRNFKPQSSLVECAKFIRDEFLIVQWAYEDYDVVEPCEVKDPSGAEYRARILTNSDKVFVGDAERLCLMNSKRQVKIVQFDDFKSEASECKYYHNVDPVQFTLEKMPTRIWNALVEKIDGQMIQTK